VKRMPGIIQKTNWKIKMFIEVYKSPSFSARRRKEDEAE